MHPLIEKNKLYYTIGEVKEITSVETHVLRYWESEFTILKPRKSRSGHRAYTLKDIEVAKQIKELLYDKKFTIKGAKIKLKEESLQKKDVNRSIEGGGVLEGPSKKSKEDVRPSGQQLIFGEVEQKAKVQLLDRDYLLSIKSKLIEIRDQLHHL